MGVSRFETRFGAILALSNDLPISASLATYAEWAQAEIDFLTQFIPAKGQVLDCGSHVGLHSISFAIASPNVQVHAFEPQPDLADLLQQNVASFGRRIIVHRCAVGSATSIAYMNRLPENQPVNAGAQGLILEPDQSGVEVQIISIDSLGMSDLAFVKLDVEGYEAEAVRGAEHTIRRERPTIFCEVNSLAAAADLFRVMSVFGYKTYFVSTPTYNSENFAGAQANMFGAAHETALLLLPCDAEAPKPPRGGVCLPVSDIDAFATLFFKAPRYGDTSAYQRDWVRLQDDAYNASRQLQKASQECEELREALSTATARVEAAAEENDRLALRLYDARDTNEDLRSKLEIERRKYLAVVGYILRGDLAARRRSVLGALARLIGRSDFAVACKTIIRSGLFDRTWYKRSNPDVAASSLEPVAHYILYGGFEGRRPNRLFDSKYYLDVHADVRQMGLNPLLHYISNGAAELRRPCAEFDVSAYLARHPELKRKPRKVLRHALEYDGSGTDSLTPYRPTAPDWYSFEILSQAKLGSAPSQATVNIIIPVYRGYDDTLACIYSVVRSRNNTAFEIVVIDDSSPEPALSKALDRLGALGLITLLRNEANLGFVGTVNRGMILNPDRDVILLNSDTLVFDDWVDRLLAHGQKADVASVTPFSNNATICSYPLFCKDNPGELEISFSELDRMAAHVNRGQYTDVPTGVGFCMYISRHALSRLGLFDAKAFGKGYGEENDFCMRARAAGMRNLHALNVFVFHSGETSFGPGASGAKQRGLQALVAKHPDYQVTVAKYIEEDPARAARQALHIARIVGAVNRNTVLCFTHTLGGGVERYLRDRDVHARSKGEALLLAVPSEDGRRIRLASGQGGPAPHNLVEFDLSTDLEAFGAALRGFKISKLEVHSTFGWSALLMRAIPRIARQLNVNYEFYVHDYLSVCPRITLIDESNVYCGEKGEAACRRCLASRPSFQAHAHPDHAAVGMEDISAWRQEYGRLLLGAHDIIAPSEDAAMRLKSYFSGISIRAYPHEEVELPGERDVAVPYQGGPLKVVVIGAIGTHKGSEVLRSCAEDAIARQLPLEFVILGYSNIPDLRNIPNFEVTGAYSEDTVFDQLAKIGAHVALFPSVFPETYSYTLTIATKGGFPICVFDIGAPAERLRASGTDALILPVSLMVDPPRINEALIRKFALHNPA